MWTYLWIHKLCTWFKLIHTLPDHEFTVGRWDCSSRRHYSSGILIVWLPSHFSSLSLEMGLYTLLEGLSYTLFIYIIQWRNNIIQCYSPSDSQQIYMADHNAIMSVYTSLSEAQRRTVFMFHSTNTRPCRPAHATQKWVSLYQQPTSQPPLAATLRNLTKIHTSDATTTPTWWTPSPAVTHPPLGSPAQS